MDSRGSTKRTTAWPQGPQKECLMLSQNLMTGWSAFNYWNWTFKPHEALDGSHALQRPVTFYVIQASPTHPTTLPLFHTVDSQLLCLSLTQRRSYSSCIRDVSNAVYFMQSTLAIIASTRIPHLMIAKR